MNSLQNFELELKDTGIDQDDPAQVVTKALAGFQFAFDDRLKAIEMKANDNKVTDRLDRMEAKINRPGIGGTAGNDNDLERKAFVSFARRGVERMGADEIKGLAVATDAAGGYLAPEQFGLELIKLLR
jgi:HK97 family phage major capsid protein